MNSTSSDSSNKDQPGSSIIVNQSSNMLDTSQEMYTQEGETQTQNCSNNCGSGYNRYDYNRASVVLQSDTACTPTTLGHNGGGSRRARRVIETSKSFWSIQFLIVFILLVAILSTGLCIWGANYSLSRKGVRTLSDKATQFSMEHISANIRRNSNQAPIATELCSHQIDWGRKFQTGLPENSTKLLSLFRNILWAGGIVTIMYGSETGTYYSVENLDYDRIYRVFIADPSKNILKSYYLDNMTLDIRTPFEPDVSGWRVTERPFFSVPAKHKVPQWVIYPEKRLPLPRFLLTYVIPTIDPITNRVTSIVGAGFEMGQINKYLLRLQNERQKKGSYFDQDGLIYVMEPDGLMIGTSVGESANFTIPTRFRADEHIDARIRVSSKEILTRYHYSPPSTETRFGFKANIQGKSHLINALTLLPSNESIWWIVNIFPERDINESVILANRIALGVSAGVLILSLFVALILGCAITRPLKGITRDIRKVTNMELNSKENKRHNRLLQFLSLYEIAQMNDSMTQMKHGLSNFQKYVPKELVKLILRKNRDIALGVVPRYMTVMFVDVKDFTSIAERLMNDTGQLISLTTDFFTHMSNIVMDHGGVIDKYLGDGMMCLFNVPCSVKDHEQQAVRSGLAMLKRLEELNEGWDRCNLPQIHIRVGINSDTCLVGNVGSVRRFDYTALGDPVNIASRLEGLNKRYGTSIIIGDATQKKAEELFTCRWISCLAMKGKSKPMHIYEVMCLKEDASQTQLVESALHEQLKNAMESKIEEHIAIRQIQGICKALLVMNGQNIAARELFERVSDPCFSRSNVYIVTEK